MHWQWILMLDYFSKDFTALFSEWYTHLFPCHEKLIVVIIAIIIKKIGKNWSKPENCCVKFIGKFTSNLSHESEVLSPLSPLLAEWVMKFFCSFLKGDQINISCLWNIIFLLLVIPNQQRDNYIVPNQANIPAWDVGISSLFLIPMVQASTVVSTYSSKSWIVFWFPPSPIKSAPLFSSAFLKRDQSISTGYCGTNMT